MAQGSHLEVRMNEPAQASAHAADRVRDPLVRSGLDPLRQHEEDAIGVRRLHGHVGGLLQ